MWQRAGAQRIIDYRELAAALSCRFDIEERAAGVHLKVRKEGGTALVRPLPVRIRAGQMSKPLEILAHHDDETILFPPETSTSNANVEKEIDVGP